MRVLARKTFIIKNTHPLIDMKNSSFTALLLGTVSLVTAFGVLTAHAEEGAGGHYVPGATSSFIDTLPSKPGLVVAGAYTYYEGDSQVDKPIKFAGLLGLGASARCDAATIFGIYQTDFDLLGGTYAFAAAIPVLEVDVSASVDPPLGPTVQRNDSASGIGDITIYPLMIGWTDGPDWKYDFRLGIYAPTGKFEEGQLANPGRNYWTFEPSFSVSWLSTKIGTEATLFTGFDINTENSDTNYRSGTSFHLDGTLAQHLPIGDHGIVGVGANAFYYEQITGDSGSGATLGDFKGRTAGVGPVISYVTKINGNDVAAELKWLPELSVNRRLKGDTIWFKVGISF